MRVTNESATVPGLVAVVGPTGAGKSRVGMALARRLGAGILCCDSVQVVRGFDIGSAKPSVPDREAVPHRLVDMVDPDEPWTAADHGAAIEAAAVDGARWIVVGGTGFYLKSALWRWPDELATDAGAREAFDAKWLAHESVSAGAIHRALAEADPATAREIHPRNVVRTLRALWLCDVHGEPVSAVRARNPPKRRLRALLIHVDPGVPEVDAAIDARCERMMAAGWLQEVENLRRQGYASSLKAMQSLGYKQLNAHLDGQLTLAEAVAEIKGQTRAYARRQRTYFRHQFPDEAMIAVAGTEGNTVALIAERCEAFAFGATS